MHTHYYDSHFIVYIGCKLASILTTHLLHTHLISGRYYNQAMLCTGLLLLLLQSLLKVLQSFRPMKLGHPDSQNNMLPTKLSDTLNLAIEIPIPLNLVYL